MSQDDREQKRMKRKQSNRESARRSRLRKQAECENLSGKVEELMHDNARLREANRLLQARVDTLTAHHDAERVRPRTQMLFPMPAVSTLVNLWTRSGPSHVLALNLWPQLTSFGAQRRQHQYLEQHEIIMTCRTATSDMQHRDQRHIRACSSHGHAAG